MRRNKKELALEIQRVKDRMDLFDPETDEHKKCNDQYLTMLAQYNEIDSSWKDRLMTVVSVGEKAIVAFGGIVVYRKLFDKSGDPFIHQSTKPLFDFIFHK